MSLEQAIDFLAKNCPQIFAPIVAEMDRLKNENTDLKSEIKLMQEMLNELLVQNMSQNI
ncbi:hypothetical protein LZ906_017585 (plasmid) [Paraclostridium ghonii]|uniref:hypothetical protein n=1 Tax=Paraclostridium ghonii TaxID=29358 RepID=UPI00202CF936|nr:hypothetical protein [Paeniclostridium ghonii]MCM0166529.1 hypothetical protein [Paeniclostridium ghonii]